MNHPDYINNFVLPAASILVGGIGLKLLSALCKSKKAKGFILSADFLSIVLIYIGLFSFNLHLIFDIKTLDRIYLIAHGIVLLECSTYIKNVFCKEKLPHWQIFLQRILIVLTVFGWLGQNASNVESRMNIIENRMSSIENTLRNVESRLTNTEKYFHYHPDLMPSSRGGTP